MLGAIIGDIVGSVYEFNNINTKSFQFFPRHGSFSDDSLLTTAVFKALQDSKKEFETLPKEEKLNRLKRGQPQFENVSQHTIKRLQEYGKAYPYAGFGALFENWLKEEHPKPYNSWGNGSAMRISSVAYFAKSLSEVKYLSHQVTAVTHNHPNGLKGAEATAVAIYMALHGKTKEQIKKYIERKYYSLDFDYENLKSTYNPLAKQHKLAHIGCKNTVPQAIFCFLISDSFEDAIRTGVSIGGDSDTLCAIIGSIAGAFYGVPERFEHHAMGYLNERLQNDYNEFKNQFKKIEKAANKN